MALDTRTSLGFSITLLLRLVFIQLSTQDPGWSFKKVREPKCLKCACMGTGLNETYRPTIMKIMKQKLYKPMLSRSACIKRSILIKGKGVSSGSDIDNLCSVTYYDFDSAVLTLGLGDGSNTTCRFSFKLLSRVSLYNYKQLHDPFDMPDGLRKSYMTMGAPSHLSIVWTDGSSFLATLCRFDGQTAWSVASIHKKLSWKAKKRILKKVAELGFDLSMAYTSDYTNCD